MYLDKKCYWIIIFSALAMLLNACGDMADDLLPDGSDRRPTVEAGSVGAMVGQTAPEFSLPAAQGGVVSFPAAAVSARGVALYFTMWCPVCDAHMDHMRNELLPDFPDVLFWVVDFVSGSAEGAAASEIANGYAGSGFTILSDEDGVVQELFGGVMGTAVLIDENGIVRMNEDYKDGARLRAALEELQ